LLILPIDAENVFIVLSARSLNPNMKIISRASDAASVPKMKKAATTEELQNAFEDHLAQTEEHVNRLEKACWNATTLAGRPPARHNP